MSETLSDNARIALISISIGFLLVLGYFLFVKHSSSAFLTIFYHTIGILYIVQLEKSIKTTAESSKIKTAHIVISAITFGIMFIYWVYYMFFTKSNIKFNNYFAK
jgi:hypothetical protein